VDFYGCEATFNGVTGPGPISDAAWQYDALTMETNGKTPVTKALPSALGSGGEAFSIAWKHQ